MVIDYEYAEWNPMVFDIANYFGEFVIDNAAAFGTYNCGIQYYENNFPSRDEMEIGVTEYLRQYFLRFESKDDSESGFNTWIS